MTPGCSAIDATVPELPRTTVDWGSHGPPNDRGRHGRAPASAAPAACYHTARKLQQAAYASRNTNAGPQTDPASHGEQRERAPTPDRASRADPARGPRRHRRPAPAA